MMPTCPLLELHNVDIAADDTVICHNVNLTINDGERHVLIGPNGSGKSTLLAAIMGLRPFEIVAGTARFHGEDLADMSIEDRARAGIGLAFQRPPALTGVSVTRLAQAMGAGANLEQAAEIMGLNYLSTRDVNSGFSGGEAKRFEVMKLALQRPSLALFDEPESGVDLEQVAVVGRAISDLLDAPNAAGHSRAALIITHTGFILDSLNTDIAHLMVDGEIVESGDASDMLERVRHEGYRN